jgi:hypothetical protein
MAPGDRRSFSLTEGGPFFRLLLRLRLVKPGRMVRARWLALFAWLPLTIGGVLRAAQGMPQDPILFDLSVYARLLVAMPMLFLAENLVEAACRSAINTLYQGEFCDPKAIDSVVAQGERLRDRNWPEVVLALIAVIGGQLALWQVIGPTGLFHGSTGVGPWSFARVWYAAVSLPLAQFVMYRWLLRWAIWNYMLAKISRLPLKGVATHPDYAAGLACVARPLSGFAGFAFAIGSVLSGAWGTQVLAHRTTVQAQATPLLAFLLLVLAIAIGPLLLFSGHLYRARRSALAQYGDFANDYMRGFHRRWIESRTTPGDALGSPDIQSLNDLGGAFAVVSKTRPFVFSIRSILAIWFGGILPMIPLFASMLTVEDVLKRIITIILGGLPL